MGKLGKMVQRRLEERIEESECTMSKVREEVAKFPEIDRAMRELTQKCGENCTPNERPDEVGKRQPEKYCINV